MGARVNHINRTARAVARSTRVDRGQASWSLSVAARLMAKRQGRAPLVSQAVFKSFGGRMRMARVTCLTETAITAARGRPAGDSSLLKAINNNRATNDPLYIYIPVTPCH